MSAESIKITVPASTANLGSGYDSLGIAIALRLKIKASLAQRDEFIYSGDGKIANNADNLIHNSFKDTYRSQFKVAPKIRLEVENPIPLARGLGSSSAALVAGIAIADYLLKNKLGRDGVYQLAAKMEGHPDNVGPAVYGGFTSAIKDNNDNFYSERLDIPSDWKFLFAIPSYKLKTEDARAVIPKNYRIEDVIFNLGRASLWPIAIAKNKPELLQYACQDKIHEPYREKLIPKFLMTKLELNRAGAYASYLSGAGPTMAVICSSYKVRELKLILKKFVGEYGKVIEAKVSSRGYRISTD